MKRKLLLINFLFFITTVSLPGKLFCQNVGIGTTTPTRAKLVINGVGGTGYTSGIFGGDSAGISVIPSWPIIGFNQYNDGFSKFMSNGYAAYQYIDPTSGILAIDMLGSGTANTNTLASITALTINNAGNVGFGTAPTNASLYLIKKQNFDGSAVFGGTDYNSHFHYSGTEDTYIRAGKAGGNVYINDQPGGSIIMGNGFSRVGINTGSPASSLEIRQAGLTGLLLAEPTENDNHWEQVVGFYNGGPETSFKFLYNGYLNGFFRPTDGEYVGASDRRIKKNIHPLPSLLEKILQLNPVTFELKYRNPGHNISYGFIAQEVQQLFPEMVSVSSYTVEKSVTIPDFHALNYNGFKMIAVKAVQEEQHMIEQQQHVQDDINKRLETIEKKLALKK